MPSIYELTGDFAALAAKLDFTYSNDELTEEERELYIQACKDTLEGIAGTIQQKSLSVARIIKNLEAEAAAVDSEIKRLQARKRSRENQKNFLRDMLRTSWEIADVKQAKDEFFTISLRRSAGRVRVVDIEALKAVPEFWKPYEYDESNLEKSKISEALKAGETVPGAELAFSNSITIL